MIHREICLKKVDTRRFRATGGKHPAASSSIENQRPKAVGRHFESEPAGRSERYESAAAPAINLSQVLRGVVGPSCDATVPPIGADPPARNMVVLGPLSTGPPT